MNDLPIWAAVPAIMLLVCGGLIALIGSIGLVRLPSFFARAHGPSMGNTLGCGCILIASMLASSSTAGRPIAHELLITLFVVVSSPVSAMLLMRAARHRDQSRSADGAPQRENLPRIDAEPSRSE